VANTRHGLKLSTISVRIIIKSSCRSQSQNIVNKFQPKNSLQLVVLCWSGILLWCYRRRRSFPAQLLTDVAPAHILVFNLHRVIWRKPTSLAVTYPLAFQPAYNADNHEHVYLQLVRTDISHRNSTTNASTVNDLLAHNWKYLLAIEQAPINSIMFQKSNFWKVQLQPLRCFNMGVITKVSL